MKYKLSLLGLVGLALNAQSEDLQTSKINVFSPGPLPSIGISTDIIPGSVYVIKPQDVEQQAGVSHADYLINNVQGFSITEVGGNPWQPDVQFRGYSAGSILGNPIGLSIFVDGVRENQPFSDVMLWDTVPMWAMAGTQVVAGSNPIYGLNTLGGAIAFQTKNGKLFNKGTISATVGSWDRTAGLIEYGGVLKDSNIDYYFGYNHTSENGWRDYSPSHLNQAFGKIGKDFENGRLELSYTGAHNNLTGNGLAPKYLLGADNSGVNTVPDLTENRYNKFNLGLTQFIDEQTMFSANAYYVQSNRYTLNGDAEIAYDYTSIAGADVTSSGGLYFVDFDDATMGASGDGAEGEVNLTKTKQDKYGISGQFTFSQDLFGKPNHLVVGANAETSLISFNQFAVEEQTILESRKIAYDSSADHEETTNLSGRTKTLGLYGVNTLSLSDQWHVTGGARWNYTEVDNSDRLNGDSAANTLTAKQSWSRINPTIGLTYKPSDNYSTYVSYSESNRAPTSIELGCSNPNAACLLPTQMADDPPLDDVVSKTYEAGARGRISSNVSWNASVYHAINHDDLQFISTSAVSGLGYFDNVGRTRRDGLDLGISGSSLPLSIFSESTQNKISWNASYGLVHATYDSPLELSGEGNTSSVESDTSYSPISSELAADLIDNNVGALSGAGLNSADEDDLELLVASNDVISVKKGDRLANIPMHRLKLRLNYDATDKFRIGTNVIGYSKAYVMGNENQKHDGDGETPGYVLVNLDATYRPAQNWTVAFKAINIFDKNYYTGGRLLENAFTGVGNATRANQAPFSGIGVMPGSPQAAWMTISYDFK
jgi:outer membrane receptor protein involved in Fe transport